MRRAHVTRRTALALALGLAVAACSSNPEPDIATLASNSDQLIWEEGQKAFDKKLWENARQHFKRIVDGFPQSEHGPAARLALGDAYFREGGEANYILAVSTYRDFLTLFPSHPRADYAQFQVGESHFKQRNAPDRDQTATRKALDEFQRVLQLYPQSSHTETARARVVECRQSLARADYLVGLFYQRTRQSCAAAVPRFESLLADYPDFTGIDEVLYRLADCLSRSGRAAEARPLLARLLAEFPASGFAEAARKLSATLDAPQPPATTTGTPTSPPSPAPDSGTPPSPQASPPPELK